MSPQAAAIEVGYEFPSVEVVVSREMISAYAAASYDFNPLHLDEDWMAEADFGRTRFGEVIAHGLMTYSLVTRMLTDVVYGLGGWHERCEMRFTAPVRAGDTVTTFGLVSHVRPMGGNSCTWRRLALSARTPPSRRSAMPWAECRLGRYAPTTRPAPVRDLQRAGSPGGASVRGAR
jgi:acyl dehydratase